MRERILLYGGLGSGKTYAWLQLARRFSSSRFYVIDTEIGATRSLQEFPEINNVDIHEVVDWPECQKAVKTIIDKSTPNDWIVVDMVDKLWSAVQRYFVDQIFDKEMGEYFLEARKKLKKDAKSLFGGRDSALKGWTDWVVIKKLFDDAIQPLVYRAKANLVLTSSGQSVSEEDGAEIQDLYGPYKIKPVGQKDLGHQPDTVILTTHTKAGYFMSTVKDRGGRKYMDRHKIVNFAVQYGVIAGWK